jgi:hypothetical protein
MIIREATFDDLQYLMPLAKLAHEKSVFGVMEMNESVMQRNFVVSIQFDDGYAKVVEVNGEVVGGLVGIVAENHFGIRCAQDMFNYSLCGTDRLIKDFINWARDHDAKFVHIADLSGNNRYHKLCQRLNLQPAGTNFLRVM